MCPLPDRQVRHQSNCRALLHGSAKQSIFQYSTRAVRVGENTTLGKSGEELALQQVLGNNLEEAREMLTLDSA